MRILLINHHVKTSTNFVVESRLINDKGEYIKFGKGLNEGQATRNVLPKNDDGEFIPTHIMGERAFQSRSLCKPSIYNLK